MRDYRNAKAMAQTLREALNEKSIALTHSESLELIAQVLGVRDWNVLSAKIDAEKATVSATSGTRAQNAAAQTCFCSFCGKSQHEVAKLIAGPDVFICDECVGLCDDVLTDTDPVFSDVEITRPLLEPKSTEELVLLKAKLTRGLSISQRLQDVVKKHATDPATADKTDAESQSPQVRFYLRKSPEQRRAYANDIEKRLARLERAMAVTTELLQLRQRANDAAASAY